MIWSTFGQKGRVMCCQSNGCNGSIPKELMKPENQLNTELFIETYYDKKQQNNEPPKPSKHYQLSSNASFFTNGLSLNVFVIVLMFAVELNIN